MDQLQNGATLGSFRILHPIGEGGMARVYKAYQPSMERYVALKVLPSHFAEDPQFVERFIREARTIAALEHRNILPVFDFGEQDGVTYLVMRYVEGGTLKELLAKGRLTLHDCQDLMSQVCAALDYAHRRKVIHRDVKPSNVILDGEGAAYLMDFGIAKVVGAAADLTATGAAIGTPAYMAPEQALGATVDGRTDIYALGVMLYEMVVGRVPFQADTPMAVLMAHLHNPLPLPRQVDPAVPEAVEAVIIKALAKDPAERYQTANDLAAAFRRAVQEAGSKSEVSTLVTLIEEVRSNRPEFAEPGISAAAAPKTPTPTPPTDPRLKERLEQDYMDGLGAYWIRDWVKAKAFFQAVLAVDRGYKDASARLAEVEKQIHLGELDARAQAAMDRKDWQAAQSALQELVELDPKSQQAASRLQTVERRLELAGLYSQAEQLAQAEQWQAVVRIFERIQSLDSAYPDEAKLLAKARQGVAQQQRLDKIKETYQRGLQALEAGKWKEAQKLFETVRSQQPDYGNTALLLQRALDEQNRSRPRPARQAARSGAAVETPQAGVPERTIAAPDKPQAAPEKSLAASERPSIAETVAVVKPRSRRRIWVWGIAVLVVLGLAAGAVLVVVFLRPGWTDQLGMALGLVQPSPTPRPRRTPTPQPVEFLYDTFEYPTVSGGIDQVRWELTGDCEAFSNFGRYIQDGTLLLLNKADPGPLFCQMWLEKGRRFPPPPPGALEAQVKIVQQSKDGYSHNWLSLVGDVEGQGFQAACGLEARPEGKVYAVFNVWGNQNNQRQELAHQEELAGFAHWYTFLLKLDPASLSFECLLEGHPLGAFKPDNQELLQRMPFGYLLETERGPKTEARTLFDNVRLIPNK